MSMRNNESHYIRANKQAIIPARENGVSVPGEANWFVVADWTDFYQSKRFISRLPRKSVFALHRTAREVCAGFSGGPNTKEEYTSLADLILCKSVLFKKKIVFLHPSDAPWLQPLSSAEIQRLNRTTNKGTGKGSVGPRKRKRRQKKKEKVVSKPHVSEAPKRGIEKTWSAQTARTLVLGNISVV